MKNIKKILIIMMMVIFSTLGWSSNHQKIVKKEKVKYIVLKGNEKNIKKYKKKKLKRIKKVKRKIKNLKKEKIKVIKKVKAKKKVTKEINRKVTLKEIEEAQSGTRLKGDATFYGRALHGNLTASGERFDMYAMTAAHKTLPMNSLVRVTNKSNGKSVTVRINDRGPFAPGRIIDLSEAAFTKIASRAKGVLKSSEIIIEVIKYGKKK